MNIKLAGNHINVTVYSECYVLKLQIEIVTSWNISLIFIFISFCWSLVAITSADKNEIRSQNFAGFRKILGIISPSDQNYEEGIIKGIIT